MTGPVVPRLVDAQLAHVEVLAALHGEGFEESWSAEAFADLLNMPGAFGVIAESDEPVGFALFRAAGGEAEIITVAVTPSARGQGIGERLVGSGLERAAALGAQRMFLEAAADNTAALHLYSKLLFKEEGRRKAYYARPDGRMDAVVMARDVGLSDNSPKGDRP